MEKKNYILLIGTLLAASSLLLWNSFKKKPSQKIKINNTIIVGTNAEYRPFTFKENDKIVGFDIDIAREVAKRLNKKIELKDMSFTALIPALQFGTVQFVAAGMTASEERAKQAYFTKPYLEGDMLLIISLAKKTPIKTVDDLKRKTAIVNEGYVSDTYMSQQKDVNLLRLPNPAIGLAALKTGRGDAFVIAESSAEPFFQQHGRKDFSITPIEGTSNSYSLTISKKYPELFSKIETILDKMKNDGTLYKIKVKWGLK